MQSLIVTIHCPAGSVCCGSVPYRFLTAEGALIIAASGLDPFQTRGAPCFESPATDQDHNFLFGTDPEDTYQP